MDIARKWRDYFSSLWLSSDDYEKWWRYILSRNVFGDDYDDEENLEKMQKCIEKVSVSEEKIYTAKFISPFLEDSSKNLKKAISLIRRDQEYPSENSNCSDVLCYLYPDRCGKIDGNLYYSQLVADLYNRYRVIELNRVYETDYPCQLLKLEYPTEEWLEKQNDYVDNLADIDFDLLTLYSKNGDVFINDYLRNGKKITSSNFDYVKSKRDRFLPLIKILTGSDIINVETLETFASYYTDKMDELIRRSPPTDKEIVAYRGMMNLPRRDIVGETEGLKGFSSMSMSLRSALDFTIPGSYLEKVIIPQGSRVIFNHLSEFPTELELLPPPNSIFRIIRGCQNRNFIKIIDPFKNEGYRVIKAKECITELLY